VVAVTTGIADAGRSQYGWLYGTEVMPERGAEVQTWVAEENGRNNTNLKETSLWWGALVGVTDQLELAFPVEFVWLRADGPANFTVDKFGIEARYRLVSQDPEDAPDFAPLVRVAVKRDVTVRDVTRVEGDLVASYQKGRFHALVDAGFIGDLGPDKLHFEFRPGAGVSIRVKGELRLGGEVYSELSLDDNGTSWAAAGPDIAWTHGRFWLSASYLIGIHKIDNAPRAVWGIAF
jgi:hypothetical protein